MTAPILCLGGPLHLSSIRLPKGMNTNRVAKREPLSTTPLDPVPVTAEIDVIEYRLVGMRMPIVLTTDKLVDATPQPGSIIIMSDPINYCLVTDRDRFLSMVRSADYVTYRLSEVELQSLTAREYLDTVDRIRTESPRLESASPCRTVWNWTSPTRWTVSSR